jgi:hypothetical protein
VEFEVRGVVGFSSGLGAGVWALLDASLGDLGDFGVFGDFGLSIFWDLAKFLLTLAGFFGDCKQGN